MASSDRRPWQWLSLLALLALAGPVCAQADYRLSVGDRVQVTVYGQDDLTGEYEIDDGGRISMPLIDKVVAAGLTLVQLEQAIHDRYKPDYLKNPRVSVEMLNYQPFYIFGEVNNPGRYEYERGMTVINAVALAGGYTHRANKDNVRIERVDGEDKAQIKAAANTVILPGDVIEVPERFF